MSFMAEFKKFALRGNIADMAIGFTVGAAFTTIAKSVVNDIIMPPVGLLMGRADFSDLFWLLKAGSEELPPYATLADAQEAGAVTVNYGIFVNNVIAFLLVALVMFLIIRSINRLDEEMEEMFGQDKAPPEEPSHKKCPYCRMQIPFRATRCPQCTSQLTAEAEEIPGGAATGA
ncbi:MAG: large conductance mechanosensitive channel protein MscL [Acidobacteriota bacterium]|nr:large conductance mechanosensitive channel protein MscL [Acidobacteriota bacterium]